jgi:hypothetical protein
MYETDNFKITRISLVSMSVPLTFSEILLVHYNRLHFMCSSRILVSFKCSPIILTSNTYCVLQSAIARLIGSKK